MAGKSAQDIIDGVKSYPVWLTFGWHDIRQRYRRSTLGPFWITLSLGVTIAGMGVLFGNLFKSPLQDFLPYLAVGMLFWNFISSVVGESCLVFSGSEGMIRQIKMPYSQHVLRLMWRNLIILAHNAVVIVVVMVVFGKVPHWHIVFLPFTLLMALIIGTSFSFMLGMLCARFRDVPQIVASVMQILFFITPIMWEKKILTDHQWLVHLNPIHHLMDTLRQPFLGQPISMESLMFTCALAVASVGAAAWLFGRKRAMIAYWV